MRKYLLFTALAVSFSISFKILKAQDWSLAGNSNASNTTSKLGTINGVNLKLITRNIERLRIDTFGRVGIGTTLPATSALLDLTSTGRGFLVPRMTTTQKNAIVSPVQGLLVFQTDGAKGFYYYDAGWKAVTPVLSGLANRALSNLTAPTAVNQYLLPDSNAKRNLGSAALNWKDFYLAGYIWKGSSRFISNPGIENTFLGLQSGRIITSGQSNTGVGYHSLYNDTSGTNNTAHGAYSLTSNTIGRFNSAVGQSALFSNTTGDYNTALGFDVLYNNTTGSLNTGIGSYALHSNTTGQYNTAIGMFSLLYNNANYNTATGYTALFSNTSGESNSAFGYQAMNSNTTGSYNTATGDYSLYHNTTGVDNTANGYNALYSNTISSYNSAQGYYTLYGNDGGYYNTAQGYYAMYSNITGSFNTGIGYQALFNNGGSYNTGVGDNAGYFPSSYSTFFGTDAYSIVSGVTNSTCIGYGAIINASNKILLGNTSVTSIGGYANWSNFSDGRYKKNIKEDVPGLEFINQLRPVTYNLDVEGIDKSIEKVAPRPSLPGNQADKPSQEETAGKQAKAKIVYTGFVAQEVEQAASKLNYDFSGVDKPQNSNGFYGLRYGDFVVPLVKAVQELSKENEELKKDVSDLKDEIKELKELVNKNTLTSSNELSNASLEQNTPNPFNSATIIHYYIPQNTGSAKIVITDMSGKTIKSISLNNRGSGEVTLNSGTLSAGSYNYTLWMDGKQIESKKMIIAK